MRIDVSILQKHQIELDSLARRQSLAKMNTSADATPLPVRTEKDSGNHKIFNSRCAESAIHGFEATDYRFAFHRRIACRRLVSSVRLGRAGFSAMVAALANRRHSLSSAATFSMAN